MERERERICAPLVTTQMAIRARTGVRPKPGARNFKQVSHQSSGTQGLGLASTIFPATSLGDWIKKQLQLKPAYLWDTGRRQLNLQHHSADPRRGNLIKKNFFFLHCVD